MKEPQSFKIKSPTQTKMPRHIDAKEPQAEIQSYVDTKEAAIFLGLSVSALRKWCMINFGPRGVKFGRVVRYRLCDLEAWAAAQATVGQPQDQEGHSQ